MRLSSWWDWIPLLLSLICCCSFPFSAWHRLPEPARTHRPGPITAAYGRRPLIGREVQAAAGVPWRDVTHALRSTHCTCCLAKVQLLTELHSKHADLYSQSRFRQPITNVTIDIIDIFDLLWKPSNLSYVFCIIFVGEDVSAFDECQLKFIT